MSPQAPPHILLVDDEPFIRDALSLYFESNDFVVSTAGNGDEALEVFRAPNQPLDVVVLDLVMPGAHGLEILREMKRIDVGVEVVIATGCGTMHHAVEALRLGAFDFVTKPILDFDTDLLVTVRKAIASRRSRLQSSPAARRRAENLRGAPTQARASSGESHLREIAVLRELERFARLHAHSGVRDDDVAEIGTLLRDGFGAQAAIVLERSGDDWRTVRSWGFPYPVSETDVAIACARLEGEERVVAESPLRWGRVLEIPFRDTEEKSQALLLFFANELLPEGPPEGPHALLAAVLSWIFRAPPARGAPNDARLSSVLAAPAVPAANEPA